MKNITYYKSKMKDRKESWGGGEGMKEGRKYDRER